MSPEMLGAYAQLCGWTLARAHARSGDAVAIGSYLGGSDTFPAALADFAAAYADQNDADHQALVDAIADGSVAAESGV
jgi:predicted alpha/beta hydrolase